MIKKIKTKNPKDAIKSTIKTNICYSSDYSLACCESQHILFFLHWVSIPVPDVSRFAILKYARLLLWLLSNPAPCKLCMIWTLSTQQITIKKKINNLTCLKHKLSPWKPCCSSLCSLFLNSCEHMFTSFPCESRNWFFYCFVL